MSRLTRRTFMGDYAVAQPCRNEDEYLNALRAVVQRLGKLEDDIEAVENEELAPLPMEDAHV
jgi:alpha-N-acetylglucosamine transferase